MRSFLLALLGLWVALVPARAQVTVEVYSYSYADPALLSEAVKALVPGERKVILNPVRQELMVVAEGSVQAQVKQLITRLDRPVPNVQIRVDFAGSGVETATGGGVNISGEILRSPGGGTSRAVQIAPRLQAQKTTMQSNASQFLTVTSGKEAKLSVGQRIPYLDWMMTQGLAFSTTQASVGWQEVGAFLVIQPVVVGEGPNRMVKVKLTPELSGTVDGRPQQVRYSRVATEVMAREGQTVSLGGLAQSNEFFSRFLVGMDHNGATQNLRITLTPDILD